MGSKRYTLLLPDDIHRKLMKVARERQLSAREVVLKSLKLGVLSLEFDSSPSNEIVFREYSREGELLETKLLIL